MERSKANVEELKSKNGECAQPQKKQMGGFIGNLYQSKISMLFLYKGLSMGYEFEMGTEIEAAEKFDDIVFKYKNEYDSKDHFVLVQAKHKTKASERIKRLDLLSADDVNFGLVKYFNSYRKAKDSVLFKDAIIDYAVVYTNSQFNEYEKDKFWKNIDVDENENRVLNLCKISDTGGFYRFDYEKLLPILKPMIVQYSCEYTKIAERLVKVLLEKHTLLPNDPVFKKNHHLLAKEVINIQTGKFFDSFVNCEETDSKELKHFRKILSSILNSKSKSLEKINEDEKIKFNISRGFGKPDEDQSWPEITIVKDEDIKEFLEKAVFAVDQPNEDELGKAIEDELRQNYFANNITYKYLVDEINSWTKGGNFGTSKIFISHENAKSFFTKINMQLNEMTLRRPIFEYLMKINEFEFRFNDLRTDQRVKTFLSSKKKLMNIVTECVKLSAVKLYRVLQNLESVRKSGFFDYFIFTRLSRLIQPISKDIDAVVSSFKNPLCSHSLLVIECDINVKEKNHNIDKISIDIFKFLEIHNEKKIIFIKSAENDSFFDEIINIFSKSREYEEVADNKINFNNLTLQSQNNILKKLIVKFQNNPINLCDIVSENAKSLIDRSLLKKIINNEQTEIANLYIGSKDISKYYISRKLYFEIQIYDETSLFSGLDEDDFYVPAKNDFKSYKVSQEQTKITESEESYFEQYFDKRDTKVCLMRKLGRDFVVLRKSRKFQLLPNMLRNKMISTFNKKCVLLISTPGMGKSSVFRNLCFRIKENNPSLWVYKIDLNDMSRILCEIMEKSNFDQKQLMKFLKEALKLESDFETNLFENCLDEKGVVLLFDGIDEISPYYTRIVIDILKLLATKNGVKKIFISSRPHESILDEMKYLDVLCCKLQPFSKEDQKEFLEKFWLKDSCTQQFDCKLLKNIIEELISVFSKNVNDSRTDFLGIPIHLMMIATVSKELLDKFKNIENRELNSEQKQEIHEMLEISSLYEKFVEYKFYDIFHVEKSNVDLTRSAIKSEINTLFNSFIHKCKMLSLKSLFDETQLYSLLTEEEWNHVTKYEAEIINDFGEKYGIIISVVNNRPQFVHKTFAEYFVANFILDELEKNSDKRRKNIGLFFETITKEKYHMVCNFLDCMMQKKNTLKTDTFKYDLVLNKLCGKTLHFVMKNDWENIAKLLIENGIEISHVDLNDETIFHLACRTNSLKTNNILEFIMKNRKKESKTIIELLQRKNNFKIIPLFQAIKHSKIYIVKTLIETMNQLKITDTMCTSRDRFNSNILHLASVKENDDILKLILRILENDVEKLKKLFLEASESARTPFHLCLTNNRFGNLKVIVETLKQLDMFESIVHMKNQKYKNNILHLAALKNVEILQFLLNELNSDSITLKQLIREKNDFNQTPLDVAMGFDYLNNFTVLFRIIKELDCLNDVIITKNSESNMIHLATEKESDEFLRFLLKELKPDSALLKKLLAQKNITDETPLKVALNLNRVKSFAILLKTLRELDELSTVIEAKDNYNRNILHLVSVNETGEIFQSVLNELNHDSVTLGLLLQQKNNLNQTALHSALHWNCTNNAKVLIETLRELNSLKVIIDSKDEKEGNVLHTAANSENDKNLQFLMYELKDDSAILKTLLRQKNKSDQTPLQESLNSMRVDNFKILLRMLRESNLISDVVFAKNNESNILHLAVMKEGDGVLQMVLEELKSDREVLKKLLQQKNNLNQTPLHSSLYINHKNNVIDLIEISRELNILRNIIEMNDCDNRNILHLAFVNENEKVLQSIMNELKSDKETLKKLLKQEKNFNQTPLHFVLYYYHSINTMILIKALKELNALNVLVKTGDRNSKNILHLAVLYEDKIGFSSLIDEFKDNFDTFKELLQQTDCFKQTPLHTALFGYKIDNAKILIQTLRDFNSLNIVVESKNRHEKNLLLSSTENEYNRILQFLLEELKNDDDVLKDLLGQKNVYKQTPLHLALCFYNSQTVKSLVKRTKDWNTLSVWSMVKDNFSNNILHLNVLNEHSDVFKLTIDEYKSDCDTLKILLRQKNNKNQTPLHRALEHNHINNVMILIQISKELNVLRSTIKTEDGDGRNVFHFAVEKYEIFTSLLKEFENDLDTLKKLLQKKDYLNRSPLHEALYSYKNHGVFLVRKLKESNALHFLIEIKDDSDRNILHLAVVNESDDSFKYLISELESDSFTLKTLLKQRDSKNDTPLHVALCCHRINNLKILIGISKNMKIFHTLIETDGKDKNLLHLAVANEGSDVLLFILNELKSDSDSLKIMLQHENAFRRTPLHFALTINRFNNALTLIDIIIEMNMLTNIVCLKDYQDNNVLHLAAKSSYSRPLIVLLENLKSDCDLLIKLLRSKNIEYDTPLQLVLDSYCHSNNEEVLILLVKCGIPPEEIHKFNRSVRNCSIS